MTDATFPHLHTRLEPAVHTRKENNMNTTKTSRSCLILAVTTAMLLCPVGIVQAQSTEVIVDPAETRAAPTTPTLKEAIEGMATEIADLTQRADRIRSDHVDCVADATRDAAGEIATPQKRFCGISLEAEKIGYFETTKGVLRDAATEAAAQRELVAKDIMAAQREVNGMRKEIRQTRQSVTMLDDAFRERLAENGEPRTDAERETYDNIWRNRVQGQDKLDHLFEMEALTDAYLERLAEVQDDLGGLSYELAKAAADQDTLIQRSDLWIKKARRISQVEDLVNPEATPGQLRGLVTMVRDLGSLASYRSEGLPGAADLQTGKRQPDIRTGGGFEAHRALLEDGEG